MPASAEFAKRFSREVRKADRFHSERIVSSEVTLQRARRAAAQKGVTRLADITGLDRIGIPTHCAIVPRSNNLLSVYSGKGLSANDSRVSALMEAIERQTALCARVPVVRGSYRELHRGKIAAVDPGLFTVKLRQDYSEERPYLWVEGYDFLRHEPVLVPAGVAGFGPRYATSDSPYASNNSNGLASGNCFEEAFCHGLCELLERDSWTLAELRSQWIPWVRREKVFGPEIAAHGRDDPDLYPRIDLRNAGEAISGLMNNFACAGLSPVVRDITSDIGIPTVLAAVGDDSVPGFPQAHGGTGCHPNARIAIIRALTELAQSRAVDIQGMREDLSSPGEIIDPAHRNLQRVSKIDTRRWLLQQSGAERPFAEMLSIENESIAEDIDLLLARIAKQGIQRVITVDFSEPGEFAVVRVLVPGVETWVLDQGKLGSRAVEFWRTHV